MGNDIQYDIILISNLAAAKQNKGEVNMFEKIKVGTVQLFQKVVTKEDTALNYGSGVHKNLLATPSLVAFMIECTTNMVDSKLPEGFVTVGKSLSVKHLAPTARDLSVTVEATLSEVDGNHLNFNINVYDEIGLVATGTHERFIVKYDKFMDKVEERVQILTKKNLRVEL